MKDEFKFEDHFYKSEDDELNALYEEELEKWTWPKMSEAYYKIDFEPFYRFLYNMGLDTSKIQLKMLFGNLLLEHDDDLTIELDDEKLRAIIWLDEEAAMSVACGVDDNTEEILSGVALDLPVMLKVGREQPFCLGIIHYMGISNDWAVTIYDLEEEEFRHLWIS